MKSKKLSDQIIKTFKSNGFVLSEPDVLLDSEYIIQRSGENFRRSMLTFENEDGKVMCLRPDLTVASCIKYLEKKSKSKIYYSGQAYRRVNKKGSDLVNDQLGIEMDAIDVIAGDSATTPYGGGAWASRGMAMGGEAALQAGKALKGNILDLAASILQTSPEALTLEKGEICDVASGEARMDLAELAKVGYFRQDTLPSGSQPELMVTRHHVPDTPYYVANGVQGAHVEVDVDTGFIKLLGWWVADDCGRVVNPLMVDEQIRGGVIQGIGNALFEHSQYDETGQLLNASLADYLLPMSAEMPDIKIGHVETPLTDTEIGANGIGESGTIGAIAALWCAVNDALRPLGAQVSRQPFTPEHILEVIAAAQK